MLSRLPITLAQLKAGNNSEEKNLKIKYANYYILRTDWKKNLQKQSIKVWTILFKNENNLYKHRK